MSKGSNRRPQTVDNSKFGANWDIIFGKTADSKKVKDQCDQKNSRKEKR